MADVAIHITGTATRDPELRYTTGGAGVATFGVAVNERYMKDGKWVDGDTTFFNVVAWRTLGENCAQSVTKGMRVIVTGKMKSRSYETQEGEKRTVWELAADEVGPSLRWANASVEKTVREGPADREASAPAADDPEPPF